MQATQPLTDPDRSVPQVIFLDAMGTLFGIQGSVGEIYSAIATKYGVVTNAASINQAFAYSFKNSSPLAFESTHTTKELTQKEFLWWKDVVQATFTQLEILDKFTDFSAFFSELYLHFSTHKPWYIYTDVIPSLKNWQHQGIQLGVISNFDTRLYKVLKLLKLDDFFDSITISSEAGAAKPNPKIFRLALQKHNCISRQAWHIGDSFKEDYEGAKKVGIRSFWLNRSEKLIKHHDQLPNLSSVG